MHYRYVYACKSAYNIKFLPYFKFISSSFTLLFSNSVGATCDSSWINRSEDIFLRNQHYILFGWVFE